MYTNAKRTFGTPWGRQARSSTPVRKVGASGSATSAQTLSPLAARDLGAPPGTRCVGTCMYLYTSGIPVAGCVAHRLSPKTGASRTATPEHEDPGPEKARESSRLSSPQRVRPFDESLQGRNGARVDPGSAITRTRALPSSLRVFLRSGPGGLFADGCMAMTGPGTAAAAPTRCHWPRCPPGLGVARAYLHSF